MRKIISLILSVLIVFSIAVTAFAEETANTYEPSVEGRYPTVIVPGLMQSKTRLYNEDGTENTDVKAPFFIGNTDEIVSAALKDVVVPLLKVLLLQEDVNGEFVESVSGLLCSVLGEKIKCDKNGDNVYDVQADRYLYSYADCTPEEQKHILDNLPITDLIATVGGENVYYFSFNSFGNIDKITDELYAYIQMVKEQTGSDKVNIVPISQGGSVCNNLLEYYPQVMADLNRIVYVIPALDGTEIISNLFKNGLLDDNDALYGYMMYDLLDEETAPLVNIVLRMLPNKVVNALLDVTVDKLINDYLQNSTCIWAFATTADYEELADKYLSDEGDEEIRRQADRYQKARANSDANILKAKNEYGVQVFDIVNYNDYLYKIVDCWDDVNADGIIHLDSTSMGAYSLGVNVELPADYVQQGNAYGTCSDPENHNHIDPIRTIDASTALLPDHTFYFNGGDHEQSGRNDVMIKLVEALVIDESIKDVYSCPDKFPQFNNARITRGYIGDIEQAKAMLDTLDGQDKADLEAVIASSEAMIADTVVDIEEHKTVSTEFYTVYDRVRGIEPATESFTDKMMNKLVTVLNSQVEKNVGYNSFSGK